MGNPTGLTGKARSGLRSHLARCQSVVTHNTKDFQGLDRFGLAVETPYAFLKRIGALT